MEQNLLTTIAGLSKEFGAPDFVKGGGGNSSAKTADTLWVKPSDTTLSSLTPAAFVALDRAKLAPLYQTGIPANVRARESCVKEMMAAAVKPGHTGRPSVVGQHEQLQPHLSPLAHFHKSYSVVGV